MCSANYLLQPRVGCRRPHEVITHDKPSQTRPALVPMLTPKQRHISIHPEMSSLLRRHKLIFLLLVFLTTLTATTSASEVISSSEKFPSSEKFKSSDNEIFESDSMMNQLMFTQEEYSVVIPENSLGKVYAVPSDLSTKMGIYLPKSGGSSDFNIRFRIKSGDKDDYFKAESERVGNFVFLLIRTRTNNMDVLNRERKASYELEIRARVRDKDNRRLKAISEVRAKVRVTVKDVNDLDPFFQPSTYAFIVPEDTPLHQVKLF
jgi:hypothetical protein